MVVDDVVLVFADDVHGGEDIESVIDAPLDILEIDFLANIAELLVHLEDLVGDLSASDHGSLSHFLQHGARQEHKLLVFLVLVILHVFVTCAVSFFGLIFPRCGGDGSVGGREL